MSARTALMLIAAVGCAPAEGPSPERPRLAYEQFDCRAREVPAVRPEVQPGCFLDPACDRRLVVGHRGAGGNFGLFAPENSLSAVRFAILVGADAVELDVRHTADDRLVIMHDGSLERTAGVERDVSSMMFDEVRAVGLKAEGYLGDFGCEVVPSFDDVLALAKDRIAIVVDTKTHRGDLVARAIRDAGMIDQASVSVPSIDKAVSARTAVSEVKVQLRPDSVEEYETMLTQLDRPPEVIEIDEADLGSFRPIAAPIRAKLFVNLFVRDLMVYGDGQLSGYEPPYEMGADVGQTEFSMWALEALGRRYWSALPQARDLGIASPLLGN